MNNPSEKIKPEVLADQLVEEIIEPERLICDAHHHLWVGQKNPYLFPELIADLSSGHRIASTVYIECGEFYRADGPLELQPVGETDYVAGLPISFNNSTSELIRPCKAIVGMAELSLGGAVEAVLQAHVEAGRGRFRGIRRNGAWDASPDVPRRPAPRHLFFDHKFREGFACLQKFGLVFDVFVYQSQLEDVVALARTFPEQKIVVDHVGGILGVGPYKSRQQDLFLEWKASIKELAHCPNVFIKLGGLGMKRCGFDFHLSNKPPSSIQLASSWRPWIETCIEEFGVNRCMFESNFAMDKISCSYAVLWNAFKILAKGAAEYEKSRLFFETAVDFYNIP